MTAAELFAVRMRPSLDELLRVGLRKADETGISTIDSAYECHLGSDLIKSKHLTGRVLLGVSSVSKLVEALLLDPATQYFPLARLYSVFKHIEKHRRLPLVGFEPASAWISTQEKYAQHAVLFDTHHIVDVMMEHIEPLAVSFLLGLPLKTVHDLKEDFMSAHHFK